MTYSCVALDDTKENVDAFDNPLRRGGDSDFALLSPKLLLSNAAHVAARKSVELEAVVLPDEFEVAAGVRPRAIVRLRIACRVTVACTMLGRSDGSVHQQWLINCERLPGVSPGR